MKKVIIHVVVKYRENEISTWISRLQYGNSERFIKGVFESESENDLKVHAIKLSIEKLKEKCSIEVFCEAEGFRDAAQAKDLPKELKFILAQISQIYFVPEDDLPPIMKELTSKIV